MPVLFPDQARPMMTTKVQLRSAAINTVVCKVEMVQRSESFRMMTQWQFYREVLQRAYRGGYSWAHKAEVVVAIALGAFVFIPAWESWLKPILAVPFVLLMLHVLIGPYYYAYTIYRESEAKGEPNRSAELTEEIRKKGSREFGNKLQAMHDNLFLHWQDAIARPDRENIHRILEHFYERLKNMVHDDDGNVLHLKSWRDVVDLLQEANTWKTHTRSGDIPFDVGTGLFTELDRIAKAFPKEAGPPAQVEQNRGTTPIQFCGQNLRQIHNAYENGWKEAKEERNRAKGVVLISTMNTALSTLMNEYRYKITPDDRWPTFLTFVNKWTALVATNKGDDYFFREGDLLFYQMKQIAHAFQLRPDPLP